MDRSLLFNAQSLNRAGHIRATYIIHTSQKRWIKTIFVHGQTDRRLMLYALSTAKGHIISSSSSSSIILLLWRTLIGAIPMVTITSYLGKTKCIPTTSNILIHYLKHINPLKIWINLEKMKLNEPGRRKFDRYRSPVSRHSTRSYIPTHCRSYTDPAHTLDTQSTEHVESQPLTWSVHVGLFCPFDETRFEKLDPLINYTH